MLKEDIKFSDSTVFEGMMSIRAIIKGYDEGINDRKLKKILFDVGKLPRISKEIGYFKAVSAKYGFELQGVSEKEINALTVGSSHGGIIALTGDRTLPCPDTSNIKPRGFYAMIQGIEDPYNFGYSIRSLYACGCDGIVLGERNWLSAAGVVCRSSAGASELINAYKCDELEGVKFFKNYGYNIVCADENTDNILGETELSMPLLLIVGGEKRGVSKSILDLTDTRIKISYAREFRASLSAASATTMFAYEIMRQINGKKQD